ncbi:MAG: exopolysaccharide biosynthesis protein [Rhizobiaceae bacterium]|nr:exopolysaccharide biosynthesis protein [Rhizobiaceae bacterium]
MNADTTGTNAALSGPASAKPAPRRLSQVLRDLGASTEGPVAIGTIRDALGDRSFAALLVLFAVFNLLPLPPGATLIFGLPLLLITGQMVAGYRTAWLPRTLLARSISADRFRGMIQTFIPKLERLEKLVKPRRWPFPSQFASDRIIGIVGLVLSIAVTLPIPLGNWLPAFALALIGLSLSERDGIFLAGGIAVGVVSLLVIAVVIGAASAAAGLLFGSL